MKRRILISLAICMLLSCMVSCANTTIQPGQPYETESIGIVKDDILTLYVSDEGDANFTSIEAARDYIRTLDKANYRGIDVIIKSGTYTRTATLEFTAEDSGTEECKIRYIGEVDAILNGGIEFDYTEFEKASGDTLLLFPEAVRDKLYTYDLSKLGYTPDDIANMKGSNKYYNQIGIINVDGKQMDLARYPNADEGWIEIVGGYFLDKNGNYTENDGNNGGDDQAVQTIIEYGTEHMDRVLSWKNYDQLYVRGHYKFIWCRDDTKVTALYDGRDEMLVPFSGGYFPVKGGLLFFYNIPEELDVPGEYYVDDNAVLYYYPEENFTTARFTVPTLKEDMININGAEWLILENLTLESTHKSGIVAETNNLTIKGCTVRDIYEDGISCEGYNITVVDCEVAYIGGDGLRVDGGDAATLQKSNNVICNNYVHNWSTRGTMNWGVVSYGCGATICHNEVGDSTDLGMCATGPYHTVEYNYIYKTNKFFCDGGALNTHDEAYGTVLRYNVIIDTGYETELDIVGVAGIISDGSGGNEIYGNIVYYTTGDSLLAAGIERDVSFHNNLCIKPGREGYEANCPTFAHFHRDDWDTDPLTVPEYLYSDIWQNAFPTLKGIHGNYDPDNHLDPSFYYAPANNYCYDNYLFLDKAYNTYNEGYKHWNGKTEYIEDEVAWFCPEDEMYGFSDEIGNITRYTSKRNKNPITIGEALAIANEAVGTIMTPEQLEEVGRFGVDYDIDSILVE